MREKLTINTAVCKGCYYCIKACPKGALSISEEKNSKGYHVVQCDADKCITCGMCFEVCPDRVFRIINDGGEN